METGACGNESWVNWSRNVADQGATKKTKFLSGESPDVTWEPIWWCAWQPGSVISSSRANSSPGTPIRSRVIISTVELLLSPSNHSGGEYVFHQKTVAVAPIPDARDPSACFDILVETMVGIFSWVGITPPWWYTPIRNPKAALKIIHAMKKGRDLRTQVSRRGTHGIKKRGSWCGKIDKIIAPDIADMARLFLRRDDHSDQMITRYAGPRSCGRFTRKCW